MQNLSFKFKSSSAVCKNFGITAGVVNSGNLEILLEKNNIVDEVLFSITTTVPGFDATWHAVLEDFATKYAVGGCSMIINDCGATPAVVSLRLRQVFEDFVGGASCKDLSQSRYLELNARDRINAIADSGSFKEWLGATEQITSPHLQQLNLPTAFDDGVIIGEAMFAAKKVCIAAQKFAFMGGAVGEVNGAKLAGLCLRALRDKPSAVILLLDSGGVRLQEANAGEIAISEIISVILRLRMAKIPVVAVVAGKNGVFGGIGILSQCLDDIIITENARTGISGPEVIETVMGTAEYDASDRALVWRTCGGRHRAIMGDGKYSEKSVVAIKCALNKLIEGYQPLSLDMLQQENKMLAKRLVLTEDCLDGTDIWKKMGYLDAQNIPNLTDIDFIRVVK